MESGLVKLLLVDDIGENLLALAALLRRDDLEIYTALSGAAALDLLLEHDFALAIIDVQMPDMNGFELAEFMRSTERTKRIPIIFVTAGSGEPSHAFKGYESGAVDFLYKPLDSHTVKSKVNIFVEMYLQRGSLSRQVEALELARAEQEKLLVQLQQVQAELQQAVRMRDDFMSIVSHELRTPLNTLKLELYTRKHYLERGDFEVFTPQKIEQMVNTDERQLDRLIRLINDILDVSRIRTGQLSVRPSRVDLGELAASIVEQLQPQCALSGCEARLRINEPAIGQWDEFRLEQVLVNLLTNAIRHGAGKPIEVHIDCRDDCAILSVRDYGIGIKSEDRERIFHQFERGKNERKGSGLGLGLFITDQIVRAHGGAIDVVSAPGAGATFSVTLPREMPAIKAS